MLDGKVLEGKNRYRACRMAEVEPRFEEFEGGDPLAFVISKNLRRRHLDTSQRAMIAAKLATMRQGARTDLAPNGARSDANAAEAFSVGERTVERAKAVRRDGSPELIAQVERGEVSVSAAAKKLKPAEEERPRFRR